MTDGSIIDQAMAGRRRARDRDLVKGNHRRGICEFLMNPYRFGGGSSGSYMPANPANVKLLVYGLGGAGATAMIDSSPTGNIGTAVGDAKIVNHAILLDGTGDCVTFPDSNDWDLSGDFSVELRWTCATLSPSGSTSQSLITNYTGSSSGWSLQYDVSVGGGSLLWRWGDGTILTRAWVPTVGVEYHIAVCRAGGFVAIFVDGVLLGARISDSTNYSGSTKVLRIGALDGFGTIIQFTYGRLRDVRIIKGEGIYTGSFSPPPVNFGAVLADAYRDAVLADLPAAYYRMDDTTGTLLDGSGNGRNGTYSGGYTQAQASLLAGGTSKSVTFNGTSGYATVAGQSAVFNRSRTFSVEVVFKTPALGASQTAALLSVPNGGWYLRLAADGSAQMSIQLLKSQSGLVASGGAAIAANTRYHVVFTIDASGNWVIYVNNAVYLSGTTALTFNGTVDLQIGRELQSGGTIASEFFPGTIDEISFYTSVLSAARVAVHYGAATNTDPNFSSTALLLHADGANNATSTSDNSATPKAITFTGAAKISTAQSVFGGSSFEFSGGTGIDYVAATSHADFALPGDFTLELFVRWKSKPAARATNIFTVNVTGGLSLYWDSGQYAANVIRVSQFAVGNPIDVGWNPNLNQTYHLAIVRSGTALKLYIDELLYATGTMSASLPQGDVRIGGLAAAGSGSLATLDGFVEEVRLTKGVARGIGVPVVAYPNS